MSALRVPVTLFRAALLGGAVVGLAEGVRAGLLGHLGAGSFLTCVIMVAGFDVLLGALGGLGLALLLGLGAWGRQGENRRWASIAGWGLAGAVAASAPVIALIGTAGRNNRFLAAGIVALASLLASAAAALLGPALARALPFSRSTSQENSSKPVSAVGLLILAPLVAVLLELAVFFIVWRTRAPLPRDIKVARALASGAVTALLPWAVHRASLVWPRWSWWKAAVLALLLFGAPTGVLIYVRWAQDFQFMAWNDVRTVSLLGVTTLMFALVLLRRGNRRNGLTIEGTEDTKTEGRPIGVSDPGAPPSSSLPLPGGPTSSPDPDPSPSLPASVSSVAKTRLAVMVGLPALAVLAVLLASESEPARKAGSTHTGLTGNLLALGQKATDWDHDGYSRFFGGGDCDDRDPERNPGATDWPDDGIDQDCDGKDASTESLRSPLYHPVPASVPADLKLLFVTIDTLRADHLGCYGYGRPTSPALDRLASESVLFENGWAHAPSTRYSMPAIATGRWPSAIKWDESIWWPRIDPSMPTIAEALHDLGYTTGALYAYLYFKLADRRGFERGIDFYDDECAALHMNVNGPMESVGSSSREMADKGIAFLRAHGQEKFFLWMHFYDPHLNYQRHPEAPDFGSRQADLYDNEIWFTDFHFGRVLDELKAQGLWDKTAIIVVGDHGESLGEHNINAHGYHLYSPHTKVPFIVRVPGVAPRREKTPVGHVDLAPTMVNLARGPHQPAFLGRSFVDLLAGRAEGTPPQPVFQEVSYEGDVKRRAWVTATHHLIWNWTPDNTTECYDLAHDPGELRDLWGSSAGEAECAPLKSDLRNRVALLSLPAGYADKIADSVFPAGKLAPRPSHVLDGVIGDDVRVTGYDLSSDRVGPGGEATLNVYFESLRPVARGWRPFFHMDGPAGFRNLDHIPVEGAYPMDRWRPGQHIRDKQIVRFPLSAARGDYTLYFGLFKGGSRMSVTPAEAQDGKDRLRLATIHVE
jgi:arylsulfatase A-like enzyme